MKIKSAVFIPYHGVVIEDGKEYEFFIDNTVRRVAEITENTVVYIYDGLHLFFGRVSFHANPVNWSEEGITVNFDPREPKVEDDTAIPEYRKMKVNGNVIDELRDNGESVRFELEGRRVVSCWKENADGLYYFTHPTDVCGENHFLYVEWWSPRRHVHIPSEPSGTLREVPCDAVFDRDNWRYGQTVSESQMRALKKTDMTVPRLEYIEQALLLNRIGETLREQAVIKSYK